MKKFFKTLGWALSLPFVLIATLFNLASLSSKAKKYKKNSQNVPLEDRFKIIYKVFNKALYFYRIEVKAEDFEKLPSKQMLIIPNHKSWIDPLILFKALYETGRMAPLSIVAKAELTKHKTVVNVVTLLDGIFLKRDDGRSILNSYNVQNSLIKKGYSIIVYPEGTRIKGDTFGEYKPAVLKVAFENYIAICPVVSYGCENIKEHGKNGKHTVYIKALKVIQPNKYINNKQEYLMSEIQTSAFNEFILLKNKVKVGTK